MSAGESLSRARMLELGVPRPQLQVPVEDADGPIGLVDFGWPGVAGEFDGRRKYAVPAGATPREAEQVLWAEKRREDRIRRQLRLARWTWRDAMAPARLGPILAEQGVRPVPRPRLGGPRAPPRLVTPRPGSGPSSRVVATCGNGGATAPPSGRATGQPAAWTRSRPPPRAHTVPGPAGVRSAPARAVR